MLDAKPLTLYHIMACLLTSWNIRLAKTYHDKYINDLCDIEKDLEKYNLRQNQGYGTKLHYEALKLYGPTKYHRKSFNLHL